jgi:hypothetical protein
VSLFRGVQSPDWEPQKYEPGWLAIGHVAWLWKEKIFCWWKDEIYLSIV